MHKHSSVFFPVSSALDLIVQPTENGDDAVSPLSPPFGKGAGPARSPLPNSHRSVPKRAVPKAPRGLPPPHADISGSRRRSGGDRGRP